MRNLKRGTVFIAEPKDISKEAIGMLAANGFSVTVDLTEKDKAKIEGIFIRTYTNIDEKYLKNFPNLKFILRAGVGIDNIDVNLCKEKNISIYNAPGSNSNAVAEYVIMSIFFMLRQVVFQMSNINKNKWRDRAHIGSELRGKTIGLVGCGYVGKLIAKKLQGFDVGIIGYDPYVDKKTLSSFGIKKVGLNVLISNADIISLHLPLTPETSNMFIYEMFSKMKKTSIFINTSRGELVVEKDLIKALKDAKIAGAILDVFVGEPRINRKLFGINNLLLTPHIAGFTIEADVQIAVGVVNNLLSHLET